MNVFKYFNILRMNVFNDEKIGGHIMSDRDIISFYKWTVGVTEEENITKEIRLNFNICE